MIERDESIDAKLARLGRETEGLAPRSDFNARVMATISSEAPGRSMSEFTRPARHVIPFAALLAALSIVWAVRSEPLEGDSFADGDDVTIELEW